MDDQQQRNVNEAAEKFADAVKESFQTIADRAVSTQEANAQLTQNFFNTVISNLRTQAESNRAAGQELADQQQRQQEAAQALTQESVSAYMDLLDSMFSYYRGSVEEAARSAGEAQGSAQGSAQGGAGQEDENRQAIREIIDETNRRSGL